MHEVVNHYIQFRMGYRMRNGLVQFVGMIEVVAIQKRYVPPLAQAMP